jgi:hypothetical protein
VGYQAGYSNTTAYGGVFVGYKAGYSSATSNLNTMVGDNAGLNTTGAQNTFIGQGAGSTTTTGAKNTVLGRYDGNQGGLDIRTSSNNIVLSDGDGNPRQVIDSSGNVGIGTTSPASNTTNVSFRLSTFDRTQMVIGHSDTSSRTVVNFFANGSQGGSINTSPTATSYNTSSDYRLKENVADMTSATTRLKQLNPVRFNFIADADTTVDGFLAHEVQTIVPEAITGTHNEVDDDGNPVYQGIDQSKLVPLLVATIQELEARIATLEAE